MQPSCQTSPAVVGCWCEGAMALLLWTALTLLQWKPISTSVTAHTSVQQVRAEHPSHSPQSSPQRSASLNPGLRLGGADFHPGKSAAVESLLGNTHRNTSNRLWGPPVCPLWWCKPSTSTGPAVRFLLQVQKTQADCLEKLTRPRGCKELVQWSALLLLGSWRMDPPHFRRVWAP